MGSLIPRGSAIACLAITFACAVPVLAAAPIAAAAGPAPHAGHLVKSGRSFKGDVRRLPAVRQTGREGLIEREPPPIRPQGAFEPAPLGSGLFPGAELPAPAPSSSFEGLHFSENCGGVQCGDGHPPDTNGDVGPRHYIQTINTAVGIYDKSTGTRIAGFSFNALMGQASFGNLCDTDNFGDPVVLYDSFHDRWIITDFAFQVDGAGNVVSPPGAYECFAVSKTGDPVSGGWNFYSLHITDALQDYPKLGVWPDGLYMSANMFGFPANGGFKNVRVWSLNLAQMEAGAASPQVVSFDAPKTAQGIQIFTLLPSNARAQAGTPPAGRPAYFTGVWGSTNSVQVFAFHVDWNNTANSTFTGPTNSLTGASWGAPPTGVPSKSGNDLDTLAIRLMAQNQYSNIGGVESLWNSHTVQGSSSSQAAVRWYQIPVTGGAVGSSTLQASTFNPDTSNRFMPSVAVDRSAGMALGYSVSSSTLFPAIRYAGRVAGDPAGTLGQSETSLIEGTGSQSGNCGGSACERWGDYSAMTLDPDGCTFWYTNEYYVTSGLDHHTRIGSFALPGCTPIAMGRLQGTATNASTASPISGAVVTAGIYSTTTDSSGNYSFPKIPAGSYSVEVAATGYSSGSASGVSVSSGGTTTQNFALSPQSSADHLTITSSTANLASGSSRILTAEIRDAGGNLVTGDNSTVVTFAKTSGSGTVTGLGSATASGGIASKTVTGATAGSVTVTASATGLTSGATTFTVTPGTAAKLVFTSSTANLTSGSSRTLTAEIRDAADNRVTSDNSTSVTFAKTGGTGTVTGLGSATASSGIASKSVTGATAGSITIGASAGGLTPGSTSFGVVPGAAAKVVVTSSTGDLEAGTQRTLTAEIRDAADNLVTTDNSTAVTFSKTAGAGTVTGLGSATAASGIASKSVTGAGAGAITISAGATGLTSGSTSFTVTPGTAAKLVITSSTTSLTSGSSRTLTAEVRDASDNLITTDNSTSVTFAKTAGSGTVTGLGSATASGGVASKSVTGGTAGSITIGASAGGLTPGSTSFTVAPGSATHLVFTSSTADLQAGTQRTLTAELRDAADNLVTTDNSTSVTFAKTAGSGTLTGLGSATAAGGIASKTVTGATAGSVTVTASKAGGGLTTDTTTFGVTPGTASKLVFTSSAADLQAGTGRTLTAEIRDAGDNLITSDNSTVVQFAKTAGSGSVSGLGNATASGGVASLGVTGSTAGSVTLTASKAGGGLTSGTTTFSVTPGAAAQLVFTSSTAELQAGTERTLTAEIRDAADNLITSDNSTIVQFAQTAGSGTVDGLGDATAANGIASKTVTGASAGSVTVTAAKQGGGLTPGSTAFDVTDQPVPAPTQLAFTSSTAKLASGTSRDITVEIRDDSGQLVTSSSAAVTLSQVGGGGTLSGVPATASAANGVATFPVTGVHAGSVTLQAASTGLGSATTSFTVGAGGAHHLTFTAAATSDLTSGSPRDLAVEVRDANDNLVDSSAAAIAFAASAGSGSVDGLGGATALGGRATAHLTGAVAGPVAIEASSPGLVPASVAFTVVPGPADHLAFTSAATNLASGEVRELVVAVRDAHDNGVQAGSVPVELAKTGGTGTVTGLPATLAVTGGTGSRAVTGFLAGPLTISATSSGLGAASTTFRIAPGPARRRLALKLSARNLSGRIRAAAPACTARVPTRIEMQPKAGRPWKTVRRLRSSASGTFKARISRAARYRAVVARKPGCAGATSRPLRVTAAALRVRR